MNTLTLYQNKQQPLEVSVWRTIENEVSGKPDLTNGVTRVDLTDNGELILFYVGGVWVYHRDQYTTFNINYNNPAL